VCSSDLLAEAGIVQRVALEGADGPLQLNAFRAFPESNVVRLVSEHFLKAGTLGGAEFAGLTAKTPPALYGVEDLELYRRNLEAVRRSADARPRLAPFLNDARTALLHLKSQHNGPALSEYNRRVTARRDGKEDLASFVRYLAQAAPMDVSAPNLERFLRAAELEKSLDFRKVELERTAFAERLTRGVDSATLDRITREFAALRAAGNSYASYAALLERTAAERGVPLAQFPHLRAYIRYVLIFDGIRREAFLTELDARERAVGDHLARSPEERKDRKSTRLNSSHRYISRMPSSA
jgi:hypothetical protein